MRAPLCLCRIDGIDAGGRGGGSGSGSRSLAGPDEVDSERLFASSEMGQRITKELEAKLEPSAAENRQIEADLTAPEELDLTEKRTAMKPDEFRLLADAFDEKVKRIRAEQDAKQRDLQARRDAEQQALVEKIADSDRHCARARCSHDP